jgi:hypothetical protein
MSTGKAIPAAEFSTTPSARHRSSPAFPPLSEAKIPKTVQVGLNVCEDIVITLFGEKGSGSYL